MFVEHIFCDSIFKTTLDNNKHKDYFLNELNSCKESNLVSNVGGFQSKSFSKLENKEILNDIFLNPAYKFIEKLNPIKNIKLKLINYWINKNNKNDYNLMHCHEGFLSGVYYVSTPKDCGKLVFQNGNLMKMTNDYFKYFNHPNFWSNYSVEVKEGDIYLFPSNTLHFVEPNKSSQDRVSVAFNLKIE